MSEEEIKFPIKPVLYLFDNDQTYDLLRFQNVDGSISGLISDLGFEINGINLIDCFSPSGSAWADQWTTKFINALWKLSRTHLLYNAEINGQAYGFEPKFKSNRVSSLGYPEQPETVDLVVKKGNAVTITWLYKDDDDYPESLPSCNTWTKAARSYQATSEDLTVTLPCGDWLFNSCVINGNGSLNVATNIKQILLYEYLDRTLAKINSSIALTNCEVLTGITAKIDTAVQILQGSRAYPFYGQLQYNPVLTNFISFSAPTFQQVPDNYFFCGLVKANNNAWNNGRIGNDIGKKIGIKYFTNYKSISLYFIDTSNNYFSKNKEVEPNNNIYAFDVSIPNSPILYGDGQSKYNSGYPRHFETQYSAGLGASLIEFTTDNNQQDNALGVQSYPRLISGFPPIVLNSTKIISNKGYLFKMNIAGNPIAHTNADYSQPFPQEIGGTGLGTASKNNILNASGGFSGQQWDGQAYSGPDWRSGTLFMTSESYGYYSNPTYVAVPFLGDSDYSLFANGQVGLIKNAYDVKTYQYIEWYIGDAGGNPQYRNTTRTEVHNKTTHIVNVDYQDIENFLINSYNLISQREEGFTSTNVGDISLQIYSGGNSVNWNFWVTEWMSQEIPLRRDLRIGETINIPDVIEVTNA